MKIEKNKFEKSFRCFKCGKIYDFFDYDSIKFFKNNSKLQCDCGCEDFEKVKTYSIYKC